MTILLLILLFAAMADAQPVRAEWDLPADDRRARILAMREKMIDPRTPEYGFRHDRGDSVYVEDRWNVDLVARVDNPQPLDIVVQNNVAYVAANGFLTILDVSDPARPRLIKNVETPGGCVALDAAYPFVYLLGIESRHVRLTVLDISQPTQAREVGRIIVPYNPLGGYLFSTVNEIQVYQQTAYIRSYNYLFIVDVSDPARPVLLTTLEATGQIHAAVVADDLLYLSGRDSTVVIYDVSHPAQPDTISVIDTRDWGVVRRLYPAGNKLYLTRYESLKILDITLPQLPIEIAAHRLPGVDSYQLLIQDNLLYVPGVSEGYQSVQIFDVGDPAFVPFLGEFRVGFGGFYLDGRHLYLTNHRRGVYVVEVSDPVKLTLSGFFRTLGIGFLTGVYNAGDVTYLTGTNGLAVFDTSVPTVPRHLTTYGSSWMNNVKVYGSLAYIALDAGHPNQGLLIVDVSQPGQPAPLGFVETEAGAYDVEVRENYAYIASHYGLVVADVSNPAQPFVVASGRCEQCLAVDIENNHLYLASGAGLYIYDISNPVNPIGVRPFGFGRFAEDVDVKNKVAYLASSRGLTVVDVGNPAQPIEIVEFSNAAGRAVEIVGQYAYVAGYSGLRVIDIHDPTSPIEVGYHETLIAASQLHVNNGLIYVADWGAGLYILQHRPTAIEEDTPAATETLWLGQNHPNPVAQRTTIPFSLPQAGPVTLSIYNSAGRFVKTLIRKNMAPGRHEVIWDAAGAAAGMYFYQLTSAHAQTVKKLCVMRSF